MISSHPSADGQGIILQMRETEGKPDSIAVDDVTLSSETLAGATRASEVLEVNVLEEPLKMLWQRIPSDPGLYHPVWIRFKPYETKFVLLGL